MSIVGGVMLIGLLGWLSLAPANENVQKAVFFSDPVQHWMQEKR